MITGAQIRAARAAIRWSAGELGRRAGVSLPTVQRLERSDGVPPGRSSSLQRIQEALEAAGIEFIGTPTERPGVRFRPEPSGNG